jgi:hypothetical protein
MRRNLSALAASILHRNLLNSGCELPAPTGEEAADQEQDGQVRRKADAPRLMDDNTTTQSHRPRGHGA